MERPSPCTSSGLQDLPFSSQAQQLRTRVFLVFGSGSRELCTSPRIGLHSWTAEQKNTMTSIRFMMRFGTPTVYLVFPLFIQRIHTFFSSEDPSIIDCLFLLSSLPEQEIHSHVQLELLQILRLTLQSHQQTPERHKHIAAQTFHQTPWEGKKNREKRAINQSLDFNSPRSRCCRKPTLWKLRHPSRS